ncbi:MAG: mechanosensitive ion channel [Phycisphaeraceae bacterium]|nr:MAG: mechanosensitive ion channel [Phycisphaeraceae bacterium]
MRVTNRILRVALLSLACFVGGIAWAKGQDATNGASGPPPVTAEEVQVRLDALDPTDTTTAAAYKEALAQLDRAKAAKARTDDFTSQTNQAPAMLASIRQELSLPPAPVSLEIEADAPLIQYEQGEAKAEAQLQASRDQLAQLQSEASKRQERRTQIPASLAQSRQKLAELDDSLNALPPADAVDLTEADRARRMVLRATRQAVVAEIAALEAEQASYDARRELLPARTDRANRQVSINEQLVNTWRDRVAARRQQEAEKAARDAAKAAKEAAREHPVLQAFAAESKQIAETRASADGVPQKITNVKARLDGVNSQLSDLTKRYLRMRKRIETTGLNRATGLAFRREFESLPDTGALRRRLREAQRELEDAQYAAIERGDEREQASRIDDVVRDLLDQIAATGAKAPEFEFVARELANARKKLLEDLVSDSDTYSFELDQLVQSSDRLYKGATEYETFIGERILWVRSIASGRSHGDAERRTLEGNRPSFVTRAAKAVRWQLNPKAWSDAWSRTRDEAFSHPGQSAFGAAVLLLGFLLIWPARRGLGRLGELVGRYKTDRLRHTVEALVLTVLVSWPIPALIWAVGWLLARPTDQPEQALALGAGVRGAALLLFPLLFAYQFFRPLGIADAHFRWSQAAMKSLRRHLRWFVPAYSALIALVVAVDYRGEEDADATLGRLAFTAAMLALAAFLQRVLRPHGAVLGDYLKRVEDTWIDRLKYLWYPVFTGVPLALTLVGWLGYYYTSIHLESRFELSLVLILGLVLANGLLMRWLFVARRNVAVEDAKRRREQATPEQAAERPTPIDADKLNLPAISLQTQQLFRLAILLGSVVGLFAIWAGVLPALRMLDRLVVYPEFRIVEANDLEVIPELEPTTTGDAAADPGAATSQPASGQPAPAQASGGSATPAPGLVNPAASMVEQSAAESATSEEALPDTRVVTLADLGLAAILLIATFAAFRNLPGLIEIAVLQRLPLDAGSRYALSTVIRYLIAIVGIMAALGAVGISWSRVQWLAAALTFGLAFGLQEIFANFVSGLIILAERPIRIGDTVTVGGVSGSVTRVRMRATTITDWDRKELVIPNKTFITGEVINWTLSDPILRVTVPVGVSYDSDPRRVEAILLKIAAEHPIVLADPAPRAPFMRFGDSTLDFELRVYIPHIDHFLPVRHDLHLRIMEAFREAGIEIAFPQRDLHIRSAGPITELLSKHVDPAAAE